MRFRRLIIASLVFASTSAVAQGLNHVEWSGDIRYRMAKGHEDIDENRTYQQLRARLVARAEVNDEVHAVLRLATATSAVNQDQTLGDSSDPGMARRPFGIDWSYLDWQFHRFGNLWAGRTANPFWSPDQAQLVFDEDLAFEGIAIKWHPQWSHSGAFINLGGFIISENYAAPQDLVDTGLVGGDIGWTFKQEDWSLTTHFGNYYYLNIQNKAITSLEKNAATDPYSYPFDSFRGNSVYPNDPLLPAAQRVYYFTNKYILLEAGAEWKQRLGPIDYTLFYDWVKNDKVKNDGIGTEYGFTVRWRRVWFSAAQITKGRDAVVGSFTDNYANGGGTDNRGNRLRLGVELGKNAVFAVTQYQAKRGLETVEREFVLTQADVTVHF